MMYDIFDPNWIKIVQGNSREIKFNLLDPNTGEPLSVGSDDVVLFTVKSKLDKKVIQKILTSANVDASDNTITCMVRPYDTEQLITGEYWYDVLYVGANEKTVTFISSIFQVLPAIGLSSDVDPAPPSDIPDNAYVTADDMVYVTSDGYIYVTKGE
jgi:hypothetical protein